MGVLTTGLGPGGGGSDIDIVTIQHFEGSAYTTTSATLVAIDDAALGIELTLAVGDEVHLDFGAPFGLSGAGNVIRFDWLVDGPGGGDTLIGVDGEGASAQGCIELGASATDANQAHIMGHHVATEDGVHTFLPRWRVSGGATASIRAGGGTYNAPVVHRAIVKRA